MITHNDDVEINVLLDSPPPGQLGFGASLLISDAANSSLPAGTIVRAYADVESVALDWTATEEEAARVYFSQEPKPTRLFIGEQDVAGGQTIDDALRAILSEDDGFYGVAANTRTDSEQETLSGEIESQDTPLIHGLQSSLDDIVTTSSDPILSGTDLEPVIGRERTMILYHAIDAEWYDLGQLGGVLPFDPDIKSAPWYNDIKEVADTRGQLPAGALIGSQQSPGNVRNNNANIGLPFYTSKYFTKPGQNANGRQMAVIISRDWFRDRLSRDVGNEIVTEAQRGNRIPVGQVGTNRTEGQVQFGKLVKNRLKQGERAGHFLNWDLQYPEITQANKDNGIVPLEADVELVQGAQAVTFTFNFTRSPV